tara:strand:+ start:972 stop:1178 length:207 start_codon:yes stop_codon:yes gene_type:complete
LRRAIRSGKGDTSTASLIIVYTLAQALGISPLEVYQMPAKLVQEMLMIHGIVEEMKAEELEKQTKKAK